MLTKNKRLVTLLSLLLVATMLIPATPVFATAENGQTTAQSLADNLLLHYDFEGESFEAALKNKSAKTVGVADDLQMRMIKNEAVAVSEDYDTYFTLQNGIMTSKVNDEVNDDLVALRSGGNSNTSANIKKVTGSNSQSVTWFVRYYVADNYTSTNSDVGVFDADYNVTLAYGYRHPVAATSGNPSETRFYAHGTNNKDADGRTLGAWRNTVATKTYNASTGKYDFSELTFDDGMNIINQQTVSDVSVGNNVGTIALFAFYYDGLSGSNVINGSFKGLSIDDFRIYDTAISAEDAKALVAEEFVSTPTLSENLVIHYDFDGAPTEILKDKATAGASAENLKVRVWDKNPDDTSKYKYTYESSTVTDEYFTVENGVITSKVGDDINTDLVVLRADAHTTDLIPLVKDNMKQNATYFVRYQVAANYTGSGSDLTVFDAGHNSKSQTYYSFRSTTTGNPAETRSVIFMETFPQGGKPGDRYVSFADGRGTLSTWRNTVMTKSYNEDGSCEVTHITFDDNMNVIEYDVYTYSAELAARGHEWGYLALFANVHEGSEAGYKADGVYGSFKGLSMDDFRIYNTDLSIAEVQNLVRNEFLNEADVVINRGAQKSLDGNKVRLVAEIDGVDYQSAGFYVTATWTGKTEADPVNLVCNFAYTSLLAEEENGNINPITPNNDGYYLIAVVVDNIPTDKADLKLTFTPYTVSTDGKITLTGEAFVYDHTSGTCSK